LQRERDAQKLAIKAQKKKTDLEKEIKKLEKEREAAELHERIFPICMEHVEKGLQHVLTLNLGPKRDILKYVYAHVEAKSNLRVKRANELIKLAMLSLPPVVADTVENESGGNSGAVDEFELMPLPSATGMNSEVADTGEGDDEGECNVDALDELESEAAKLLLDDVFGR